MIFSQDLIDYPTLFVELLDNSPRFISTPISTSKEAQECIGIIIQVPTRQFLPYEHHIVVISFIKGDTRR